MCVMEWEKRTSMVSSLTGSSELSMFGLHMRTAKKEVDCDERSVESLWKVLSSHETELGLRLREASLGPARWP